jgi:CDP-diacylglycerol pyrophosphatase
MPARIAIFLPCNVVALLCGSRGFGVTSAWGGGKAAWRGPAMRRVLMYLALAAALAAAGFAVARAADPDALWKIVHGSCVPDQRMNNDPRPCTAVALWPNERSGHALLKDLVGATQFLLIPTARLGGIESPELLSLDAPNYMAAAWAARAEVEAAAGHTLPRQDIGLAINSVAGRTQDQLHIHIDCLRPDVIAALHAAPVAAGWTPITLPPEGHSYLLRRLDSPDLVGANPFQILAEEVPQAATDMHDQTLVVAGAPTGFYLLDDHVQGDDHASGEELQDHDCAVGKR